MNILKFILCLSLFPLTSFAFGENWQQVADEGGIKVWQAEIPGTSVFRVRGQATLDQSISKLVAVINSEDIELKERWIDMLVGVKLITSGQRNHREYHDYSFPWPANNRDLVLNFATDLDPVKRSVSVKIDSIELPEYPESMSTGVRGEAHFFYTLTYLGPNKTGIDVNVWADPKGYLPKFMVNMVNRQWPLKTLRNLERETAASTLAPDPEIQKLIEQQKPTLAH